MRTYREDICHIHRLEGRRERENIISSLAVRLNRHSLQCSRSDSLRTREYICLIEIEFLINLRTSVKGQQMKYHVNFITKVLVFFPQSYKVTLVGINIL